MKSPTDHELLAFLSGELDREQRDAVLEAVEADPDLGRRLRSAAQGLAGVGGWSAALTGTESIEGEAEPVDAPTPTQAPTPIGGRARREPRRRTLPAWTLPLTAAASLALAVPLTLALAPEGGTGTPGGQGEEPTTGTTFAGAPESPDPSFVLVLQGQWPDAGAVGEAERNRRAREYWEWTTRLAERGVLVAAGDLRWEPGLRVDAGGEWDELGPEAVVEPGFLVGMFALRTDSYEEALALARECPHLRYGGSISVRQVGGGFVTVPGMGDWSE